MKFWAVETPQIDRYMSNFFTNQMISFIMDSAYDPGYLCLQYVQIAMIRTPWNAISHTRNVIWHPYDKQS